MLFSPDFRRVYIHTLDNNQTMKHLFFLFAAISMAACTTSAPSETSDTDALFAQNCKTARALIRDFDNEDIAAIRSHFADSAVWRPTTFGQLDTPSLEDKVAGWTAAFAKYDFDLATKDLQLLPGVSAETKQPDGSVRVYFDWDLVRPATDTTERKSVTITYYESWEFDSDGKIWLTQIFGDKTAAMQALDAM